MSPAAAAAVTISPATGAAIRPPYPAFSISTAKAMRKGSVLVWPTTVTVTIGKPIETAGLTLEDRDQLIARVRDDVQRMLG